MNNAPNHHLIFEGAELAGKSWLMSQVYDHLEPKYNQNKVVLDGCHWFNCDVGVYGTEHGKPIIDNYINIFSELKDKNILVEKLHLADTIYNRLHQGREVDYSEQEKRLAKMNFKIVLIAFKEDEELLKKRIQDRLNLYPHYERILRDPKWYLEQQKEYKKEIENSNLPHLIVETVKMPDNRLVSDILKWIGEV